MIEYFMGRRKLDLLSGTALHEAVEHFERAIRYDTNFAQAYAGLAAVHISTGYPIDEPAEHFRAARTNINAALALDDGLPEAKIADGLVKYFYEWDWQAAEQSIEEALRLDPSMVEADACYLHSLDVLGRGEDALKVVQRAVSLHPTSLAIQSELGCAAYYAGKFDQAVTFCRETLKTDPDNFGLYWLLGRALAQQQHYDDGT